MRSVRSTAPLGTAIALAIAAFVVVTIGTSLIGRTALFNGGVLAQFDPWYGSMADPPHVANPWSGDTVDYFGAQDALVRRELFDGRLATWNPYSSGGSEMASVPTLGLLAPTGWPLLVLPSWYALAVGKLVQIALAFGGVWLFLRRLSLAGHAAAFGGLVYATTGFMMSWSGWPQAAVAATVPWLFWAVERYLQLRRPAAVVPVALATAALVFGGFPALTGLTAYLLVGYMLVRLVPGRRAGGLAGRTRALVGVAAGGALGVALAAVQLLPFGYALAGVDLGYRDDQFRIESPLSWSVTSVFAHAWGVGANPFNVERAGPVERNTFVGAAAVVFAAVALLRRSAAERVKWYFAAAAVVSFLLIFEHSVLVDWMGELPAFAGNNIGRVRALLMFAGAVLAGFGFDAVLRSRPQLVPAVVELVALLGGFAGLALVALWVRRRTAPVLGVADAQRPLLIGLACAATAVVLVVVATRLPRYAAVVLCLAPVPVAVQAVAAARPLIVQTSPDSFYPPTPAHEFLAGELGSDRFATVGFAMFPGTNAFYEQRAVGGHAFAKRPYHELLEALDPAGWWSPTWFTLDRPDQQVFASPLLDRLGARFVVSPLGAPLLAAWTTGPPASGAVELTIASTTLAAQTVRAVAVTVLPGGLPDLTADAAVAVTITDPASGVELATARRRLAPPPPDGRFPVPLPDVAVPAGAVVTVAWAGDGAGPQVAVGGDGAVAIDVARPLPGSPPVVFSDGVVVWQRDSALPRVRWASSSEVIASADDRLATLAAAGRVPADRVLLHEAGGPTDGLAADVTIVRDDPPEMTIAVSAGGAGYLVVADSIQQEWRATVDGDEVPIVAADHAFGAVWLPAGDHEVVLSYRPRAQVLGLGVTAASLGILTGMAAWPPARRRASGRGPAPVNATLRRGEGSIGPTPPRTEGVQFPG